MKTFITGLALMVSFGAFLAVADDHGGLDVTSMDKAYFKLIQHAILTNDEKLISKELAWYPFSVKLPSGFIKINDEKDLKRQFGKVFGPEMKKIVRNQSPDSLSKSSDGVMVGDGEIWFDEIGITKENKMVIVYRIVAINEPPVN